MKTTERKSPAPAPKNVQPPVQKSVRASLLQMLLGFLGVSAAILVLPRASRFMMRRMATSILSEVVAIVAAGLLAERMADQVEHIGHHGNGKLPT